MNSHPIIRSRSTFRSVLIHGVKLKLSIIERKVILLLSVLAQKLLHFNQKPLSLFGSLIQICRNIFGNKDNFQIFFKNLLKGKIVLPDKKPDEIVDLDDSIMPGSRKYFACLCASSSKIAYENKKFIEHTVEKRWEMELIGVYEFYNEKYQENETQAFIFRDGDTIIVAFRGTEPFNGDDWSTDFDISWHNLEGVKGRVHHGFITALGLQRDGTWSNDSRTSGKNLYAYNTIAQVLKSYCNTHPRSKFIVTGHSLGGALAVLFPAVLALHNETNILERVEAVYTFGQPRVGDQKFCAFVEAQFEQYGIQYYRFVYNHDIVPRVPFDDSAMMYKHFGTCIYINSRHEVEEEEEETRQKNFIDTMWEVLRSCLLPHFFLGLHDHGSQNYINATRLANY